MQVTKPDLLYTRRAGGSRKTPEPPVSLAKRIEGWGKVGLIVGAICYGLGLVITNAYLAQYGISEFSAFRTQYVLTGVSVLIIATAPGICIGVPIFVGRRIWQHSVVPAKTEKRRRNAQIISLMGAGVVGVMVFSFLSLLLAGIAAEHGLTKFARLAKSETSGFSAIRGLYGNGGFMLVGAYSALLTIMMLSGTRCVSRVLSTHHRYAIANTYNVLVVIFFSLFALIYSQDGYDRVAPAYGGGYPESIHIALDKDMKEDAAKLHLITDSTHGILAARLIHESADAYFLLPTDATSNAKCIRLPKKLTRGVVYLKQQFPFVVPEDKDVIIDSAVDSTAINDSLPQPDSAARPPTP